MMFWIVAAAVVVVVGLLWAWAGRHSKVRGSVRGSRLDDALTNDTSTDTFLRHRSQGGPGGGVF
jgi:hypothetical protein